MASPNPSPNKITCSYDCDPNAALGVAIFDAYGLPKSYFITPENRETAWVQIVFQSLGLQILLANRIPLSDFSYAIVQTRQADAIVFPTENKYQAWLMKRSRHQTPTMVDDSWIQWARNFERDELRTHPHFKEA